MPPLANPGPDTPLPRPIPSAIFREVDQGGVILSARDGVYFGVNEVGARIWSLLPPASRTFGELCAKLGGHFPDVPPGEIENDVSGFLRDLLESGLAVPPAE